MMEDPVILWKKFEHAVGNDMTVVGEDHLWYRTNYLRVAHNPWPVLCIFRELLLWGLVGSWSNLEEPARYTGRLTCFLRFRMVRVNLDNLLAFDCLPICHIENAYISTVWLR